MFERFTTAARAIVEGARAEARALGHPTTGTEHLLLALMSPASEGAAAALRGAGLTPEAVRAALRRRVERPALLTAEESAALFTIGIDAAEVLARIEAAYGRGAAPAERSRWRAGGPFSRRARKVLELALREALRLKDRTITPEHILLRLLREGSGLASLVLADLGVDADRLRRAVLDARDAAA